MSKTFLFQAIQFSQTVLIQTIQFSITIVFVHTQLNIKTVLFQTIQFSISMLFSSIWPIDRTLSGATTLGQSGSGTDGIEEVPHIPQSSSITGTSPSDCLVSYLGDSLGMGSNPSAEVQSVYSTAPADWAKIVLFKNYSYLIEMCAKNSKETTRQIQIWTYNKNSSLTS